MYNELRNPREWYYVVIFTLVSDGDGLSARNGGVRAVVQFNADL